MDGWCESCLEVVVGRLSCLGWLRQRRDKAGNVKKPECKERRGREVEGGMGYWSEVSAVRCR